MSLSLVDCPRCLPVQATYVGAPRDLAASASGSDRPSALTMAVTSGGTRAYRAQAVKECLDTVAVLRSYREPMENESWVTPAASERRLLSQVNAIIALGPDALERVIELALDPEVPDPGRVFAAVFVTGCVEGRECLVRAHDTMVAALQRNAAEASAVIEALSLSPNPELLPFLMPWLAEEHPRIRAAAIRVLGFRGVLPQAVWVDALEHPDATIVAAALSAPLRTYDRDVCDGALQPILAQVVSEPLVRGALRAGVSLGLPAARAAALQIVRTDQPSWADAANCLAMFGHLGDAPLMRELLDGASLPDGIIAAATLGSLELVLDLIEVLDHRDLAPETGLLARQALITITGIAAFGEAADAEQALSIWSAHERNFAAGVRYRYGRPLSPEALLHLLRTGPGQRGVRQNLYVEMLAATESRVPPFSPYDFVRVQFDSLNRIERWLAEPGVGP